MSVKTLNDIFVKTSGIDRPAAMKYKKDGQWLDVSLSEFSDTVRHFSIALRSLGAKTGDRVAILAENRPEWTMSDFAIMAAGAVSVPIYPTLLPWQIEYIINDSGSVVVICSSEEQMRKARESGFDGFLGKPLDPDRFPDQIRRILNGEKVWEYT